MAYGTIFSSAWLEQQVLTLLQLWMPDYLGEIERQQDRDEHLPQISSWGADSDLARWPEQTPPAVMVSSPGLVEAPTRDGDGVYQGVYGLEVGVLVISNGRLPARKLASDYGAAITAAIMQQPLPDPVIGIKWIGQAIDEIPREKHRSLGAVTSEFHVHINDLLDDSQGPLEPSEDPYTPGPDDPEVETVLVNTTPGGTP